MLAKTSSMVGKEVVEQVDSHIACNFSIALKANVEVGKDFNEKFVVLKKPLLVGLFLLMEEACGAISSMRIYLMCVTNVEWDMKIHREAIAKASVGVMINIENDGDGVLPNALLLKGGSIQNADVDSTEEGTNGLSNVGGGNAKVIGNDELLKNVAQEPMILGGPSTKNIVRKLSLNSEGPAEEKTSHLMMVFKGILHPNHRSGVGKKRQLKDIEGPCSWMGDLLISGKDGKGKKTCLTSYPNNHITIDSKPGYESAHLDGDGQKTCTQKENEEYSESMTDAETVQNEHNEKDFSKAEEAGLYKPPTPHVNPFMALLLNESSNILKPLLVKMLTRVAVKTHANLYLAIVCSLAPHSSLKNQKINRSSSAEVEYRAMTNATCKVTWIFALLKDFAINHIPFAYLYCGNATSIHISENLVYHECTKHEKLIDCQFV
uniref:Uncharacterized protein n=1 Tax=Cannabis sativa TaxID=3483 RepID=A0A803P179_CANSA